MTLMTLIPLSCNDFLRQNHFCFKGASDYTHGDFTLNEPLFNFDLLSPFIQ